jgi:hypothetical protein
MNDVGEYLLRGYNKSKAIVIEFKLIVRGI